MIKLIIKNTDGSQVVQELTESSTFKPTAGQQYFFENVEGKQFTLNLTDGEESIELVFIDEGQRLVFNFEGMAGLIRESDNILDEKMKTVLGIMNDTDGMSELESTALNPEFEGDKVISELKDLLAETSSTDPEYLNGILIDGFGALAEALDAAAAGEGSGQNSGFTNDVINPSDAIFGADARGRGNTFDIEDPNGEIDAGDSTPLLLIGDIGTVFERGLTSDSDDSEIYIGSFSIDSPDGISVVTVGGIDFTLDQLRSFTEASPSTKIITPEGELVITDFTQVTDADSIVTYKYTLTSAQDHSGELDDGDSTNNSANTLSGTSVPVSVTDTDGDTASGELNINIIDDTPDADLSAEVEIAQGEDSVDLVVDETEGVDAPADDNGDRSSQADFSVMFSTIIVNGVATPDYGADGAGSVEYALSLSNTTTGTTLSSLASGLYALDTTDTDATDGDGFGQGEEIVMSVNASGVIEGKTSDGTIYFTIETDSNGVVTFTQTENIWHSNISDHDDGASITLNNLGELENNVSIDLTQTITDADGDTDSATVSLVSSDKSEDVANFTIEDDGPDAKLIEDVVSAAGEDNVELTVDESPLAEDGKVSATADFTKMFLATNSTTSTGFDNPDYGTDGAGSVSYALSLTNTTTGRTLSSLASGLYALDATDTDATDGDGLGQGEEIIMSVNASGVIEGKTSDGTIYFTIENNGAEVTFTQVDNIWHSNTLDHDDAASIALAKLGDSENDVAINLTQTITDADGDTDSATVSLVSSNDSVDVAKFSIEDDGPDAKLTDEVEAAQGEDSVDLVVDETAGVDAPADDNGDRSSKADFTKMFLATSSTSATGFVDPDYGTDGAGSVAYALSLTNTDTGATLSSLGSGLYALDATDTSTVDGDGYGQGEEIIMSVNASGVIEGKTSDGTIYFTIENNGAEVTFTQTENIWHSNTSDHDDAASITLDGLAYEADVAINLTQTITDADGDTDTATVSLVSSDKSEDVANFTIEDDGPSAGLSATATTSLVNENNIVLTVDETEGQQTNPADNNSANSSKADFSVMFSTVTVGATTSADFGTDGAGSVAYALSLSDANGTIPTLGSGLYAVDATDTDTTDGDGYGQGEEIIMSVNASGVIEGKTTDGTVYFTIETDSNGVVTFTQTENVWHSDDSDHNDSEGIVLSKLNDVDVSIDLTQTVTDADGDTDSATVSLVSSDDSADVAQFNILDDGPDAKLTGEVEAAQGEDSIDLVVDETAGVDAPADDNGDRSSKADFTKMFLATTATGFADADYGTDGAGSVEYALSLTNTTTGTALASLASGLYALDATDTDATDGDGFGQGEEIIMSVNVSGVIEGKTSDGTIYFTISNSDAEVTFTQIENIWHPNTSDHDDAASIVLDAISGEDVSIDLTQTITDADGDTDSATVSLVSSDKSEDVANFTIEDDGPDAKLTKEVAIAQGEDNVELVIDETEGTQVDADSVIAGEAKADFTKMFLEVTATGFADADYGTDGAGSVEYSLSLTNTTTGTTLSSLASGLYALDATDTDATDGDGYGQGEEIIMSVNASGVIEGKTSDGTIYFTISNSDAEVTFTQVENIWHPNTSDHDDVASIALSKLGDAENDVSIDLTQTITDADGDTDSATISLVSSDDSEDVAKFSIEDDGPDAKLTGEVATAQVNDNNIELTVDESPLPQDGDGKASATADFTKMFLATSTSTVSGFDNPDYGTDGAGSVDYALSLVNLTSGSSLTTLKSGLYALDNTDTDATDGDGYGQGEEIVMSVNAQGIIEGKTSDGTVYFTISNNGASVTFTQTENIWHPDAGSTAVEYDDAASIALAKLSEGTEDVSIVLTQTITDADGDTDSASISLVSSKDTEDVAKFTIEDDGPTAAQPDATLFENNQFTITNHDEVSSAGYHNSYGYYLKDPVTGEPTTGIIVWDDVHDKDTTSVTVKGYTQDQVGFFIIPNGDNKNPLLTDDTEVTFVKNADGQWQAEITATGTPLTGNGSHVLFDVDSLNKDGQDHVEDNSLIGNQNWEDLQIPNGDGDFNDVNVDVQWSYTAILDESELPATDDGIYSASVDVSVAFSGSAAGDYGTDGAGKTEYAVELDLTAPATNVGSGLFILDPSKADGKGDEILLVDNGDGTVSGMNGTEKVFTISVDTNGVVTIAYEDQVDPANIWHADTNNNDDASVLKTTIADTLVVTQTITDADGDTAKSDGLDIGNGKFFRIEDDGPVLDIATKSGLQPELVVDETTLNTNDTKDFSTMFTVVTKDAGTDGEDTSKSTTSYKLDVKSANVDSGLVDTATGEKVLLTKNASGVIEAKTETTGHVVFTVSVDSSTGEVTLDQVRSVVHPDATNDDEAVTLSADNLIKLTRTDTIVDNDGDSDTDSATLNIGQNLKFEDDAPSIDIDTTDGTEPNLIVDETVLTTNDTKDFSGMFNVVSSDGGADGEDTSKATTTYTLDVKAANADSGLTDTASGEKVVLTENASGVIEGRTETSGELVFTVSVDSTGSVTLDQIRAVVHPDATNDDEPISLSTDDLVTLTRTDVIVDNDGDSAEDSATLNIGKNLVFEDDAPSVDVTADPEVKTLILEESFENFRTTDGWHVEHGGGDINGQDDSASTEITGDHGVVWNLNSEGVEIQRGIVTTSDDGDAHAELDPHDFDGQDANTVMSTSVNLIGADRYELSFAYQPRPSDKDSSDMKVSFGGKDLTIDSDASGNLTITENPSDGTVTYTTVTDANGWTTINVVFSGVTGASTDLTFEGLAESNKLGALIDDISLVGASGGTEPTLVVDETDLTVDASADFSALFSATKDAGADGEKSYVTDYTLGVKSAGADSGLVDTATGQAVLLKVDSGDVVGYVTIAGVETTVFTVSVDANAVVTLDQVRAVVHPDATNDDEPVSLSADDLITLTRTDTITDKDDDIATDSDSINIGANLIFEDDAPSIDVKATKESTVTLTTQDADTDGAASDTDVTTADFSGVFAVSSSSYGADGAGSIDSDNYSLSVKNSNSGLTSGGVAITLALVNGEVIGKAGTTEVFKVSTTSTGVVTLTQYESIDHSDTNSHSEIISLADGKIKLTADVTITDKDGDTASDSTTIDLGGNLRFQDVGPVIDIDLSGKETNLVVDETDLTTNASASFADNFKVVTKDVGEDGQKSHTTTYELDVKAANADSGLVDTITGQKVVLTVTVAGVVEGRTETDGDLVFTVSVDNAGKVTLDQIRAVEHPNPNADDESVSLGADDLVTLTRKDVLVDVDLDTDTDIQVLNIGQNLNFEDDAPSIDTDTTSATEPKLTVDETNLSQNASADFSGMFTVVTKDAGEDEEDTSKAKTEYSLDVKSAGADSGLVHTATGEAVLLTNNGGVIEGKTASGILVFTVSVDSTGKVTLDQIEEVKHSNTSNHNDKETLDADDLVTLTRTDTIVDNDGDTDTDSATINIGKNLVFKDDGISISAESKMVDEDALVGGSPDADSYDPDVKTVTGDLTINIGEDGLQSLEFVPQTAITASNVVGNLTSEGEEIVVSSDGAQKLVGTAHGETIFEITLDENAQTYTFKLLGNIDHPTMDVEDLIENISFEVKATDKDGDSDTATIEIDVADDIPSSSNSSGSIDATSGPVNLVFTLDISGSMGSGVTGTGKDRLEVAIEAMEELVAEYESLGSDVLVQVNTFNATASGDGAWMTPTQLKTFLSGLNHSGLTNYEDALEETEVNYSLSPNGGDTYVYFLSDGNPTTEINDGAAEESGYLDSARVDDWNTFVNNPANEIDKVFSVGIGTNVSTTYLSQVSADYIPVDNPAELAAKLQQTVVTATGSLTFDFGADGAADGAGVKLDGGKLAFTWGDADASNGLSEITATGATSTITWTVTDGSVLVGTMNGETVIKVTATGIDTATPGYTITEFDKDSGIEGLSIPFTVTDGDGDSSTSTLTLSVDRSPTLDPNPDINDPESIVYEKGLDDPSDDSEMDTGVFKVTSPDGIAKVVVGTTEFTKAELLDTNTTPSSAIDTGEGTLIITGFDESTGLVSYKYTLKDNLDHLTNDTTLEDDIPLKVVDPDGDEATGILTVKIIDDVPVANADVRSMNEKTDKLTGNVYENGATGDVADDIGADSDDVPVVVTGVVKGSDTSSAVSGNVGSTIDGDYGTLKLNDDGSYTYDLDNNDPTVLALNDGQKLVETFTYTITDSDGDTSTTTLEITINGKTDNEDPIVVDSTARVSDEGLVGGLKDTTGENAGDDTTNKVIDSGNLASDPDGDALTVKLTAPTSALTSEGQTVTWTGEGTDTLVGKIGNVEVIKIEVDDNGDYTVTQSNQIDHPTNSVEDITSFDVGVYVEDGKGGSDTGTLSVIVEDDMPEASDTTAILDTALPPVNLVFTLDISGSMGTTKLNNAINAIKNLVAEYEAQGNSVMTQLNVFATSASTPLTGWLDSATLSSELDKLSSNGYTNYEDALDQTEDNFTPATNGGDTFIYFLSDGVPTAELDGSGNVTGGYVNDGIEDNDGTPYLDSANLTAWETFINNPANNIAEVYSVGIDMTDDTYLNLISTNATTVTSAQLADTLSSTIVNQSGDLDFSFGADEAADGTGVKADGDKPAFTWGDGDSSNALSEIVVNGPTQTISWELVSDTELVGKIAGETVIKVTATGIDTDNPGYRITQLDKDVGISDLTIPYTITDGDGDSVTKNLTLISLNIGLEVDEDAINQVDTTVDTDGDGVANQSVDTVALNIPGATNVVFASAQTTTLKSNGENISLSTSADGKTLTGSTSLGVVFVATLLANGSYSFELKDTIDHTDTTSEDIEKLTLDLDATIDSKVYTVTSTITIADDVPTVEFSDATNTVNNQTVFTGTWSEHIGEDSEAMLGAEVALNNISVDGSSVAVSSFSFDNNTNIGNGSFDYNGTTYNFELVLNNDGTYVVTVDATPVTVTIDYNEFVGGVKASGPVDTYILRYEDTATNETYKAKVYAEYENTAMVLKNYDGTTTNTTTVGSQINVSTDGIGMENNILESYYNNNTGEFTNESLYYDPNDPSTAITLAFTGSGANAFGGTKNDVIYLEVRGTNGETQTILLDSTNGDYIINDDGTFTKIDSSYPGGYELSSYTIPLPAGWDAIDRVKVTSGFTGTEETNVKIAFGYALEETESINKDYKIDFDATIVDSDGDRDTSNFSVEYTQLNEVPDSHSETNTMTFTNVTTNITFIVDVSSSMSDTDIDLSEDAINSILSQYNALGDTNIQIVQFWRNSNENTGWLDGSGVDADGMLYKDKRGTDPEQGMSEVMDSYQNGSVPSADQNVIYYFGDGDPYDNYLTDYESIMSSWQQFLSDYIDDINVYGVNTSNLDMMENSGSISNILPAGETATYVSDIADFNNIVADVAEVSFKGYTLENITGGDGDITIDSIEVYGQTYTSTNFPAGGVTLDGDGKLVFDFTTGEYTYTAKQSEFTVDESKTFKVNASDEDGDVTSFDVTIDVDITPLATENIIDLADTDTIDLADALTNHSTTPVDGVSMTDGKANTLNIDLQDIVDFDDETNGELDELKIFGESGDKVTLEGGANNWSNEGKEEINGETFNVYKGTDSSGNSNIKILIDEDVSIDPDL